MKEKSNHKNDLDNNLKKKGLLIPIIFAIIVAVLVIIVSSPVVGLFPSGKHYDHLTTTAPTQTTEYVTDEYAQSK